MGVKRNGKKERRKQLYIYFPQRKMVDYRRVSGESVLSVRLGLFGSSRDLQNCIKVEKEEKEKKRRDRRKEIALVIHEDVEFGLPKRMGETLLSSDTKTKERHVYSHAFLSVLLRGLFVDAGS